MSYKNVVFVKLMVELLRDYRFTDKLSDSQKLLYFGLLLLAGATDNQITNDPKWIKRTLNLEMTPETIELDLIHIRETYDKLLCSNGLISFSNWTKLHNFKIGTPIPTIEKSKSRVREEKRGSIPITDEQRIELHKTLTNLTDKLTQKVA